jgi:hypothetical protein
VGELGPICFFPLVVAVVRGRRVELDGQPSGVDRGLEDGYARFVGQDAGTSTQGDDRRRHLDGPDRPIRLGRRRIGAGHIEAGDDANSGLRRVEQ